MDTRCTYPVPSSTTEAVPDSGADTHALCDTSASVWLPALPCRVRNGRPPPHTPCARTFLPHRSPTPITPPFCKHVHVHARLSAPLSSHAPDTLAYPLSSTRCLSLQQVRTDALQQEYLYNQVFLPAFKQVRTDVLQQARHLLRRGRPRNVALARVHVGSACPAQPWTARARPTGSNGATSYHRN